MRNAGFSAFEVLVALVLLSAFYVFLDVNFDARARAATLISSLAQGRLHADAAELARLRGAPHDEDGLPAATPFGGRYRVAAGEAAAVVSFDAPFEIGVGGVYVADPNGKGGVVRLSPSVFAPTSPMYDKALLYRETPR